MQYDDFQVEAEGSLVHEGGSRRGRYKVRVLSSPVGEMRPDQAIPVEYDDEDLDSLLGRLDRRELETEDLVGLGRTLAAILLPTSTSDRQAGIREMLAQSLVKIPADRGIRLRLRLPYELSVIPWEYMFVERAGGEGMDGFLALDPRVAIVRHEALTVPADLPLLTGDVKVVTALSAPPRLPKLDLAREQRVLTEGLKGLDVVVAPCPGATMEKLQPLLNGAGIFHFAGHGAFTEQMGPRPGTYTGRGLLAFEDESVDAEQVAITLRGKGIRLAVLAACETGHRDGYSVWSGIAPALVKAQIPAVVANQYRIKDSTAIAFSQQFYRALAAGLPIESAVTEGRIGAYNKDTSGRDWGVPVLYLRPGDGRLFEGPADEAARERAQEGAQANIRLRVREVKAGALVVGAELGRMLHGHLAVDVTIPGTILGEVIVAKGDLKGGSVQVDADVDTVGPGGTFVGYQSDTAAPRSTRGAGRAKPSE